MGKAARETLTLSFGFKFGLTCNESSAEEAQRISLTGLGANREPAARKRPLLEPCALLECLAVAFQYSSCMNAF